MYKIYTTNGFDVTCLHEYEGTYETVGEAMVALEKVDAYMDNYGYIYDCKMKEVWFLILLSCGIELVTTLAYQKRETMHDSLVEVLEEIERRNA